jgi:hypothetical protein
VRLAAITTTAAIGVATALAAPLHARPASDSLRITVTISVIAKASQVDLVGTTNLPTGTLLELQVASASWALAKSPRPIRSSDYSVIRQATVIRGRWRSPKAFTGLHHGTRYVADVVMPVAAAQPTAVRAVIGRYAEKLTGPLVHSALRGGGRFVEAKRVFTLR